MSQLNQRSSKLDDAQILLLGDVGVVCSTWIRVRSLTNCDMLFVNKSQV